jgi:hypothetical protein
MNEVFVYHELEFKGRLIKPGNILKIRGERSMYAFVSLIYFMKSNTTLVLCQNSKSRYKLFDLNEIIKVSAKRSYKNGRNGKETADRSRYNAKI